MIQTVLYFFNLLQFSSTLIGLLLNKTQGRLGSNTIFDCFRPALRFIKLKEIDPIIFSWNRLYPCYTGRANDSLTKRGFSQYMNQNWFLPYSKKQQHGLATPHTTMCDRTWCVVQFLFFIVSELSIRSILTTLMMPTPNTILENGMASFLCSLCLNLEMNSGGTFVIVVRPRPPTCFESLS